MWYWYVLGGSAAALLAFRAYMRLTSGSFSLQSYNLRGKTFVVTGATSGIGEVTVRELYDRGADVVLLCRSVAKAERLISGIKSGPAASIRGGSLKVIECVLDQLQSVRHAAKQVLSATQHIDVLVCNAGQGGENGGERTLTVDGFEQTLASNYIGHFLLTLLLLDRLKQSAPSRIVNVSSEMYRFMPVDQFKVDDLNCAQINYQKSEAYSRSKLCQVLMSRHFAKLVKYNEVTCNSLHPGVICTPIVKYFFPKTGLSVATWIWSLFTKTPFEGAQTTLYLSVCEDVGQISGQYFSDCKQKAVQGLAVDDALAQAVWHKSCELVGEKDPFA